MMRHRLAVVHGEPDQVPRLQAFRGAYPDIVIGTLGVDGPWQARVPEENGERVLTRYLLRDLLDRVADLLGEPGVSAPGRREVSAGAGNEPERSA